MDESGIPRLEGIGNTIRKRRSHRRRPDSQPISYGRDVSPLSSTPPSDDVRAGSSDEICGGNNSSRRKELSLSQCASRFPGAGGQESEKAVKRNKKLDVGIDELYGNSGSRDGADQGKSGLYNKRSSEGILAPANWKSTSREPQKTIALNGEPVEAAGPSLDASGTENKVKVKLKLRGVTRTIDANTSAKATVTLDATASRQKSVHKSNSDAANSPSRDKRVGLQGIPWKDFSKVGFSLVREESSTAKGAGKDSSGKQGEKADSARKSKRAPKKRAIDDDDDDDNDDEIRYLEKLKNARLSTGFGDEDEESSKKHKRLSKFSGNSPKDTEGSSPSRSGNDGKKSSPSEDTNYEQEEDLVSDGELESRKKKKARREPVDSPVEPKLTLTKRQRALQSGKDASGISVVEFPNGLPSPPSKKQKEQLTEVEQQLKKAEAAQRRKMQNEKAARESEAEAIRKILGQDSSRKKREGRNKKRAEELAQEKEADAIRASNTVRLVMGPNGTTVTFPNEMGLPSIFTSKPCSYPPPREICAGPSCSNPYKYRDSKTKLPLCSLQCYKAVHGNVQSEATTC